MIVAKTVEWDGKDYEVKYTFKFIQRLKSAGVNIAQIFRCIQDAPEDSGAFLDDYAFVTYEALRAAGAPVSLDEIWENAKTNVEFSAACAELFFWLVTQHYATSASAPKN